MRRAAAIVTDSAIVTVDATHGRVLAGRADEFVATMRAHLLRIAHAFGPRPVIYRSCDFKTNEFRKLEGGAQHEPQEENPMIGIEGRTDT
jgi:pyruvate, water dikinase